MRATRLFNHILLDFIIKSFQMCLRYLISETWFLKIFTPFYITETTGVLLKLSQLVGRLETQASYMLLTFY
jgi:hypothetical protein